MTSGKNAVSPDPVRALSEVAAALVQPHDVVGTAIRLLQAATETSGAVAAGLIMRRLGQDRLQLLAATSHRAEELEVFQAQHQQGPCFDAVESGEEVRARGMAEITARWPDVAVAFSRAGYSAVHALPLRWHHDVIGALNLFWSGENNPELAESPAAGMFANLATLMIIHSDPVSAGQVLERTRSALDERTVIERAKGVLAQQGDLSMDAAYATLLGRAESGGQLISAAAADIIARAQARPSDRGVADPGLG